MDSRAAYRQPGELDQADRNAGKVVENIRMKAWKAFSLPIFRERQEVGDLIQKLEIESNNQEELGRNTP